MKTTLLVQTKNPQALDETLRSLGGFIIENPNDPTGYMRDFITGAYVVGSYKDVGFLEFAITNQGYGKIVGRRET